MTGLFSGVAGFIEAAVVILVVGIFGAAEPGLYRAGLLRLVPPPHRPRAGEVADVIASDLRHWLVGQLVLMVIVGITTAVGLWLIGIPMALTLGLIAGVLELVPYLGAWLSAVPAGMIALLKGPQYLGYVAVLFLGLHFLEGYILLPLIQRRAVHLPQALTLVAQALMGEMQGPLGLFVAAPLTVAAMVVLRMMYVEDTLGDKAVAVPGEPGEGEGCHANGLTPDWPSRPSPAVGYTAVSSECAMRAEGETVGTCRARSSPPEFMGQSAWQPGTPWKARLSRKASGGCSPRAN